MSETVLLPSCKSAFDDISEEVAVCHCSTVQWLRLPQVCLALALPFTDEDAVRGEVLEHTVH